MISDPSTSVTCTRNGMTVTFEKESYYFFNASELHLRYGSCRATENSTHFILSTPLNDCGTLVNETEEVLIFWNEVQADALIIDNVITRTHDVKVPFSCSYSRKSILSLGFTPRSIHFGQEGDAKLSFLVNIRPASFGNKSRKILLSFLPSKPVTWWFIWEVTIVLFVHAPMQLVVCDKLHNCKLPNESTLGLSWMTTWM